MKLLLILFVVGFSHLGFSQDEGSGERFKVGQNVGVIESDICGFTLGSPVSVDSLNCLSNKLAVLTKHHSCPDSFVAIPRNNPIGCIQQNINTIASYSDAISYCFNNYSATLPSLEIIIAYFSMGSVRAINNYELVSGFYGDGENRNVLYKSQKSELQAPKFDSGKFYYRCYKPL